MNKGMRVGYARISTAGQKLDLQLERLADCDRVFHEKVSGKSTRNRPELQNALDFVRDGDVLEDGASTVEKTVVASGGSAPCVITRLTLLFGQVPHDN